MEASTKQIKINYVYVLIILLFAGVGIYFGVKTSRLSKQMEKDIALQAVLRSQRDTAMAKADKLATRVVILEAQVQEANKNTTNAEHYVQVYKAKYIELKNKPDVPCDTILTSCNDQLERYENFIQILKINVASYGRLADTLQLENKFLQDANLICTKLTSNQNGELTDLRKKVRRHKILNWGLAGTLVGALTVLFIQ